MWSSYILTQSLTSTSIHIWLQWNFESFSVPVYSSGMDGILFYDLSCQVKGDFRVVLALLVLSMHRYEA